jgi:hypothetical protein
MYTLLWKWCWIFGLLWTGNYFTCWGLLGICGLVSSVENLNNHGLSYFITVCWMKFRNYCKSCSVRNLQPIMLEKITVTCHAFVWVECTFSRLVITIETFIDPLVCNLFTTHEAMAFSLHNARENNFPWDYYWCHVQFLAIRWKEYMKENMWWSMWWSNKETPPNVFTKNVEQCMLPDFINNKCRSQWLRGLGQELPSLARTLGSWVRIPLKTCMSVYDYSVFVLSCVGSGLAPGWSPVQGVLPTV